MTVLLHREGCVADHKKVFKIYREVGLGVHVRRRKNRVPHQRVALPAPQAWNEQWAMDFVSDEVASGRRFRALTSIDTFSRECHAIRVVASITGKDVAQVLIKAISHHAKPEVIAMDNGPEFRRQGLDAWGYTHSVKLDFIRPG